MIHCRIFIRSNLEGSPFQSHGQDMTVYVIDELAIKGLEKHAPVHLDQIDNATLTESEFRDVEGYSIAEFADKYVRPIIIQEHFGVHTTFNFTDQNQLREFADKWVVAVNVPDTARSIPDGTTGVLVPKPYEGQLPGACRISEGLGDVLDTEVG